MTLVLFVLVVAVTTADSPADSPTTSAAVAVIRPVDIPATSATAVTAVLVRRAVAAAAAACRGPQKPVVQPHRRACGVLRPFKTARCTQQQSFMARVCLGWRWGLDASIKHRVPRTHIPCTPLRPTNSNLFRSHCCALFRVNYVSFRDYSIIPSFRVRVRVRPTKQCICIF